MGKRLRNTEGMAKTKPNSILKGHTAYFKQIANDIIMFVTFTSKKIARIANEAIETIELIVNIDPKAKPGAKSYVVPRKYVGKRSDLKGNEPNRRLSKKDEPTINYIFDTLPDIDYESANIKYKKYVKEQKSQNDK